MDGSAVNCNSSILIFRRLLLVLYLQTASYHSCWLFNALRILDWVGTQAQACRLAYTIPRCGGRGRDADYTSQV